MSEKQQTVAIGAFVIGAGLIILLLIIYLLGSGFGKTEKVVMVFDGSVKGLNIGAPLALRGVKVGEVTDIDLILDSSKTNVIMQIEANFDAENIHRKGITDTNLTEELISRGLRAQLNSQSLLTGLLYVELDFHPESALNLVDIDSPYLQFPTIPTNLERITKKLQDLDISKLTDELESISHGVNSLVSSKHFQQLPADLASTLESVRELTTQLQAQLTTSGPKLDNVLDEAAVTVASANAQLPKIATLVETNLKTLNAAIASFEKGMSGIDGLVSPDSATLYQLNMALQEMTRAGRSLQSLSNTLEAQPESLLRGKRGDTQ
ncbi:Paraquat-inducible protein B [Halioglobus japonicus]|nr:Paraquat-inducible protein B [Halioglobus japonicus]